MRVCATHFMLFTLLSLSSGALSRAQNYTTVAPDGSPAAKFSNDCVSSNFFGFSYRVPKGMKFDDMSTAPNGGIDPSGKNFVIFKAYSPRGSNRDVVNAAAEDRRATADPSAESWMRALHRWNASRADVLRQGDVETVKVGEVQFARLRFEQSRYDGVITYEAAYAVGAQGYVVYLILGSTDQSGLDSIEKSIGSFSQRIGECTSGQ